MDIYGIIGFTVCLIISMPFFCWQFKLLKKYTSFDTCKMDVSQKSIYINKKRILFKYIDYVDVEIAEQPSLVERMLSRSVSFNYKTVMLIYLKDDSVEKCSFNSNAHLYNVLKQLKPYVKIIPNIEKYKLNTSTKIVLWIISIILTLGILKSLLLVI